MGELDIWHKQDSCQDTQHGNGHFFVKKSFHKPTYCHHCAEMLWGLIGQGYICEVCNFVVHDRCMKMVVTPCLTIANSLIKNPVAHSWSEPSHFKRKFCNVCRKKLDDSWAERCEICDYYCHLECLEFVVNDCKDCATYLPNNDRCLVQYNHWREGNLPSNSKCGLCKKTCWSSECLTGMRCSWCGITAHDYCFKKLPTKCDFGVFKPIMLPPQSISIPRVDLPKAVILGINSSKTPLNRQIIEEQSSSSSDYKTSKDENDSSNITGSGKREKERSDKDKDDDSILVRIYDGNGSYRKHCNSFHITIKKGETCNEILTASLRTFHILDSPDNYYLSFLTPPNTMPPNNNNHNYSQQLNKKNETTSATSEEILTDPEFFIQLKRQAANFAISSNPNKNTNSTQVQITSNTPTSLSSSTNTVTPSTKSSNTNNNGVGVSDGAGDQNNKEIITASSQTPYNASTASPRAGIIILRSKHWDKESGCIPVYPGLLRLDSTEPLNIPVTSNVTVNQLISKSLPAFGLIDDLPSKYRLLETILDKEVSHRVMKEDEKPWAVLQNISKESVFKMRHTRFYLQDRDDPHGKTITLFVGNLPPSLSQRQYETILLGILDKSALKYKCIGPFYYEYGSLIITYDSPDIAVKAFRTLKSATPYEDKNLIVVLLSTIHPLQIPVEITPLLIFVNVKSGGCQGLGLISSFRKLLNPHQVFDLENGGPLPGLYVFRNIPKYKILICGGDGTVGWVLSCLDNVGQDSKCENPPCAVIPLGTGNDLARVLNWGPGYSGAEDAYSLLKDVIEAEEVRLDRWTLVFHPDDKYTDDSKYVNCLNNTQNTEDNTQIYIMNNYCGIGLDADISLDFHMARTENPSKFSSRLHNKSVYFKMGLRKMMKRKVGRDLQKDVKLEVDGKEIDLPPVEGLVILNILSWGSGANLWGAEKEDHQFQKPTHYDGMLEIVGVSGVVHMGQIQSGLRSGIRIAQGGHIRITMYTEMPVQVDGEPWLQQPGQCVVLKSALKAAMLRKVKHHKSSSSNIQSASSTYSAPSSTGVAQNPASQTAVISSYPNVGSLSLCSDEGEDLTRFGTGAHPFTNKLVGTPSNTSDNSLQSTTGISTATPTTALKIKRCNTDPPTLVSTPTRSEFVSNDKIITERMR